MRMVIITIMTLTATAAQASWVSTGNTNPDSDTFVSTDITRTGNIVYFNTKSVPKDPQIKFYFLNLVRGECPTGIIHALRLDEIDKVSGNPIHLNEVEHIAKDIHPEPGTELHNALEIACHWRAN